MTNLPPITTKQQEIVKLLYRYRFLNRTQIQLFLQHKDKRRVISWLKDLRDKQYLDWHYDPTDFIAKSQPAIYYLSLNGIRLLRERGEHPVEELRKRYKEPARGQSYIDRCTLIADCCLALQNKSAGELEYTCVLPADYIDPDSKYHFLNNLKPQLYFTKRNGNDVTNYVFESFELALPRYQLRKRLKDYVDYLSDDRDHDTESPPIALFVCANTADLLYVKRRVKKLLQEDWPSEDLRLRVAIVDKIKEHNVAGMIWEEV